MSGNISKSAGRIDTIPRHKQGDACVTPACLTPLPALQACVVIVIVLTIGNVSAADDRAKLTAEFEKSIQPLIVRSCGKCHGKQPKDNDLDLTSFSSGQAILARPKMLSNVAERVRGGDMPPKDAPQPSAAERAQLLSWITAALDAEAAEQALAHASAIVYGTAALIWLYLARQGVAKRRP